MPGSFIPRRRRFGNLFLAAAGILLVAGETVFKPYLGRGLLFVAYWLACFLFTLLALLMAMVDYFALRRLARDQHRELIRDALGHTADKAGPDSDPGA